MEGFKAVLYGAQGPYGTHYHALLPATSSLRSLALGHSKVPKSSTRGYQLPQAITTGEKPQEPEGFE